MNFPSSWRDGFQAGVPVRLALILPSEREVDKRRPSPVRPTLPCTRFCTGKPPNRRILLNVSAAFSVSYRESMWGAAPIPTRASKGGAHCGRHVYRGASLSWENQGHPVCLPPKTVCPNLCPSPAFLAVLPVVAERRMSNLQILREGWEFKSPSPHHILNGLFVFILTLFT